MTIPAPPPSGPDRPHPPAARVIFVNRFYHPDEPATAQLLGDLAEALAAAGFAVTVIATRPPGAPVRETRRGVEIHRLRGTRLGRRRLAGRAVDFAVFWLAAAWRLLRLARRGDTIVALTDPPLLGVGAALVGVLRGARVVHWTQDIYPEVAQLLARNAFVRGALGLAAPLRDFAWRRSAGCVTLGADMAALIARRGVPPGRIHTVRNWAPAGLGPADGTALRAERGLTGKFVVAYSGNLGRVHHLEAVVPVARALRDRPDIVFSFTGDGARRDALERALQAAGVHARFFPPEPRARLSESLAVGDLHLVTLLPGAEEVVFPSKFAGLLAAGRPVLFLGAPDCELARLVRDEGVGLALAPDDPAAVADAIARLADDPARRADFARRALACSTRHASLDQAVKAWKRCLTAPSRVEGPSSGTTGLPTSEPPRSLPRP